MPGPYTIPASPVRRRYRAVGLALLNLVLSVGYVKFRTTLDGEPFDFALAFGISFAIFAFTMLIRFKQSRGAGGREMYDYGEMNPLVKYRTLSPIPYVNWSRAAGRQLFVEAVVDREIFSDVPGFCIQIDSELSAAQLLAKIEQLRPAASLWERPNAGPVYALHAVFDAPAPWANQMVSDYGARLWLSIRPNADGTSHLRAVGASGGFGQGSPAELAAEFLPLPFDAAIDLVLEVEAYLRGAVSWYLVLADLLGLGAQAKTALDGVKLEAALASDVPATVTNIRWRSVAVAILGFLAVVVIFGAALTFFAN
jgi:hypothetical protein